MPKAVHKVVTTNAEIDKALARAKAFAAEDPRVRDAAYDPGEDAIVLSFPDGVKLSLPRKRLQGLETATQKELSRIEIVGSGTGLHWPLIEVDHYVLGLLQHIFGTQKWMAELGRRGGSAQSAAKRRAARANGKKGGRPKKQRQVA